jgi:two-component system OmpR family sensor kinase
VPKSLYAKLLAVLVGLTLIMAIIFLVVIRHSDTARNQEINQKLYRNLASRLINEHILAEQDRADPSAARKVFDRIRVVNPRVDVYLLDETGHVVAASGLNALKRSSVDLGPIKRFLKADDEALPIVGEDPSDPSRQRVFSAAPVPLLGNANGYLYIVLRGFSGDTLAQRIKQSYVLRETLWLLGSGLAIALLASAIIITLMTRPLRQLAAVMEKFRLSGFAEQPEALRLPNDEIGTLTDTFNRMADRMLAQMTALQQTDSVRRELVANISHDLRTPLASLQGYLETLHLKRAQLSAGEQRNYLEIALKQTEQLSGLVSRLFDLAKLDSDQVVPALEPFALGDLVQDVVQEFELAASNRGIALKALIRPDLPLVMADIALLERVLCNLIENALRYTPAGGTVTVTAAPGAKGAVVEVADTGVGIPPDELPRIFDRFYRVEKSRGLAAGSAGLGLAITKRILDLHGSPISAASERGRTIFRFTLAYAPAPTVSITADQTSETAPPSNISALPARAVPSLAYPMADRS